MFRRLVISVSLLAALVVAVAAGVASSACGGGGSDSDAVASMEKFLQIGQTTGTTNKVYLGQLPPGLPEGLPEYPGSTLVGSTVSSGASGNGLGVLRESGDSVDKIYPYFEEALAVPPWQIQISTYPGEVAGIQFTNVNDSTITGAVVIQPSNEDKDRSLIFLSIQSASGAATSEPFKLGVSKPLPYHWPPIPVYSNATITDTGWGQTASSAEWQITFVVQAAPQEIINFYRTELTRIGLPVADEAPQGQALVLSFRGVQGDQTWDGAVSAAVFSEDPTYVQTTIQTALTTNATPQPAGTPSP